MVASYALIVPLAQGEAARQMVASLGIGRSDLKLGRREGHLLIPITKPSDVDLAGGRIELAEFEAYATPRSYKDVVEVPDDLRTLLPSSFDIIGDLVLIKIPRELRAHERAIAEAILRAHPNLRGVHHDEGVTGPLRLRTLRHLAGETRTTTVHSEYGARLHVDLATAYFSPRLANEHQRVAQLVQAGEHFVDATAGVGPFTVLAARRDVAKRITAIDLNAAALALLRQNLTLNRVRQAVDVLEGDALRLLPSVGAFDRLVINLPHGGEPILTAAWRLAGPRTTLHYYAIVPGEDLEAQGRALLSRLAATGRGGRLLRARPVHPYSPTDVMAGFDLASES